MKGENMNEISKEAALRQIDYILELDAGYRGAAEWTYEKMACADRVQLEAMYDAAFMRLVPPRSTYAAYLQENAYATIEEKRGLLSALRTAYDQGWIQNFTELVHESLLSDHLGMAEQLLDDGLKDAAAMYASGVLEDHLRNLARKHGIDLTYKDNRGTDRPKMIG
jgi:hypothetical protein